MKKYFLDWKKMVLNGKYLSWTSATAGVLQGSILGPMFFFLIYTNDLSNGLTSNPKLFANELQFFQKEYSKVYKVSSKKNFSMSQL